MFFHDSLYPNFAIPGLSLSPSFSSFPEHISHLLLFFNMILPNDKTTFPIKDLLCRKPSPAPHHGEIRQRLVTCGKLEKEMTLIYARAPGSSAGNGSLSQRRYPEQPTLCEDTKYPFISCLGRKQGSSLGLALASLPIAGPNYQVSEVPQRSQAWEARVPGQSQSRVCSRLCDSHLLRDSQYMLLLFRNTATSKNETGFTKWKLSNKTCKHPTRTPPTSHYQVLMFENKLSSHRINKSWAKQIRLLVGLVTRVVLSSSLNISWVRRKNSAKEISFPLKF